MGARGSEGLRAVGVCNGSKTGPGIQSLSHHSSQEQPGAATAPDMAPLWRWRCAGSLQVAWLSGAHGWSEQGCGELESGPVAASLGQGLIALGLTLGFGLSVPLVTSGS